MRTIKTGQKTEVETFESLDDPQAVSQVDSATGTRKAQCNFAVGFASMPVEGAQLIVHEVGSALFASGGNMPGIEDVLALDPGDSCMYSVDEAGQLMAKTVYKADGDIVLNGGDGLAIEHARMKAAFDELKEELNSLVTVYNAHIHVTTATVGASTTPGVISPTTSAGTPPVADMENAKSDTIKIP
jgi:hypothetical protein